MLGFRVQNLVQGLWVFSGLRVQGSGFGLRGLGLSC